MRTPSRWRWLLGLGGWGGKASAPLRLGETQVDRSISAGVYSFEMALFIDFFIGWGAYAAWALPPASLQRCFVALRRRACRRPGSEVRGPAPHRGLGSATAPRTTRTLLASISPRRTPAASSRTPDAVRGHCRPSSASLTFPMFRLRGLLLRVEGALERHCGPRALHREGGVLSIGALRPS